MERLTNRLNRRDLARWSLMALTLGLMIWVYQDFATAERLPLSLQAMRGVGIVVTFVLTALLVFGRQATPRYQLTLGVGIVTMMLLEAALKVGFSPKSLALLAAWALLAWTEFRRLADREQRFA